MNLRMSCFLASATLGISFASSDLEPAEAAVGRAGSALSVLASIALPDALPNGFYDYAAVDPTTGKLFIGTESGVMAVDPATKKAVADFVRVPLAHATVFLPGGRALSTSGTTDMAIVFDARTGAVISQMRTGRHPDNAVYDARRGIVLVVDARGGALTLIDPVKNMRIAEIPVDGSRLEGADIDARGFLYVNRSASADVAVIDLDARRVVNEYALPGCEEPTGLVIDRQTGLLVAVCDNGRAIALRVSDGRLVASLRVGEGSDAVIFDRRRKLFFVPSGDSGTLSVLRETAGPGLALDQVVKTAIGARTGAVDLQSGRIYLPVADTAGSTFTVEGLDLPKFRPGTFRVLVIGQP
jgi:hypothetical protein